MKKIILLFAFFALYTSAAIAQPPEGHGENLVPNPDFEALMGKRPKEDIDGSGIFQYNTQDLI